MSTSEVGLSLPHSWRERRVSLGVQKHGPSQGHRSQPGSVAWLFVQKTKYYQGCENIKKTGREAGTFYILEVTVTAGTAEYFFLPILCYCLLSILFVLLLHFHKFVFLRYIYSLFYC